MSKAELAKSRVSILQIAQKLGYELKVGAQKSPFREDKRPSFSVYEKGGRQYYKDHAKDTGGSAFDFIREANPAWSPAECWNFLFEEAGIANLDAENQNPRKKLSHAGYLAKLDREKEREEAKKLHQITEYTPADLWPARVAERYLAGPDRMEVNGPHDAGRTVASERGWPFNWVDDLATRLLISNPRLPWAREDSTERGIAFRVDEPIQEGDRWSYQPVGYHQRWFDTRHGPVWTYVPHKPNKPRSEFQKSLNELGRTIPALPFVVGPLADASLAIVTEGQWDAATVYYAMGGETNAVVFGMRGAASVEVFLSAYKAWIKERAPTVLVIADNDATGRRWIAPEGKPNHHRNPTFCERLKAAGASKVIGTCVAEGDYGKDFNDLYRSKRPNPAEMTDWLDSLEVI